ncbi:unnamed protein product [Cylindrotheca closterium]|uniref:Uncharacterized protein n=1 Tax=Cylindrotheca closterium TaxID=2856 RepID=A0AAD2FRU6_9STRA|nr:unnamed protein product [Cylindrotheca closterium]
MSLTILRLLFFLLLVYIHEGVHCLIFRPCSRSLSPRPNTKSRENGASALALGKISMAPVLVKFPTSQSTFSSETSQISNELVQELLLPPERRDQDRISSLAKQLVQTKVSFDPTECLDGPLYFSNVIEGPSPLWEKLGIPLISKNLQGQQYTYNSKEKSVINYAEIFGSALHLRAYGTYEQDVSSPLLEESENKENDPVSSFFQNAFSSLTPTTAQMPELLTCPIDFVVTVEKASICLGDNNRINIPISGQGYLRVLYADPKLRIFVSPKSTTDDRWEKEGLMVAQVAVDQKDPSFGLLS